MTRENIMVHATVRCLSYVVVDLTLVLHVEELVSPSGKNFLFNFIKNCVFRSHFPNENFYF